MTLEEFLDELNIDQNQLVESGSPQKLRHYTDIYGLINILRSGYIHPSPYYFGTKSDKSICVVRPSGDVKNLDFTSKKYCGYFEIDFHILNDKVRNITKEPINELEIEYKTKLETIGRKYKLSKEELLNLYNELWESDFESSKPSYMSKEDFELLKKYYYNLIHSLYYKEGEERIYGNDIPLSSKYLKFFKLKSFDECREKLTTKYKSILDAELISHGDIVNI